MRYLVRHGEAMPGRDDDLRPLTDRGREQADGLAHRVGSVEAVWVSPALRCRQTVESLTERYGVEAEVDVHLSEGIGPSGALARLEAGDDVVVCSHGDVVGEVIRLLALRGVRIDGPSSCAPAGLWSIDLDADLASGQAIYSAP